MKTFRDNDDAEQVAIGFKGSSVSLDQETGVVTLNVGKGSTLENLNVTGEATGLQISVREGGSIKNVSIGDNGNLLVDEVKNEKPFFHWVDLIEFFTNFFVTCFMFNWVMPEQRFPIGVLFLCSIGISRIERWAYRTVKRVWQWSAKLNENISRQQ